MIAPNVLKRLKDNSDFDIFSEYIEEKINSLNSVEGLGQLNNQEAGEEAKIRAATILKLRQILAPVIDFVEKEKITADQLTKKKQKYAL